MNSKLIEQLTAEAVENKNNQECYLTLIGMVKIISININEVEKELLEQFEKKSLKKCAMWIQERILEESKEITAESITEKKVCGAYISDQKIWEYIKTYYMSIEEKEEARVSEIKKNTSISKGNNAAIQEEKRSTVKNATIPQKKQEQMGQMSFFEGWN